MVAAGIAYCADPLTAESAGAEFTTDVGVLEGFMDFGDGDFDAVASSPVETLCELEVLLFGESCHSLLSLFDNLPMLKV